MREYLDRDGVSWVVLHVVPRHAARAGVPLLPNHLLHGWLCFQSERETRRLSPCPADWEDCGESELERMRQEAVPAVNRHSDPPDGGAPEPGSTSVSSERADHSRS